MTKAIELAEYLELLADIADGGRPKLKDDKRRIAAAELRRLAEFEQWYEEAMIASNEAGYAGLSAADTIKDMGRSLAAVEQELADLKAAMGEPVAWMPKTWTERYVSGIGAVTCNLRPTAGWEPLYAKAKP